MEQKNQTEYNPTENHNAISIIKQSDGNYIGLIWRDGKILRARQSDPIIVLQLLLTHDGREEEKTS